MRVSASYRHRLATCTAGAALVVALAFPAHAQTAASPATSNGPDQASQASSEGTPSSDDVVVTGSRVIVDGTKAPTPVTVISGEQLAKASPGTIGEALNQLPTFQGSSRPTTGTFSSTGPGSGSFLNLRNLGVQRNLLLLDGRRVAPSALTGATDTNTLPQELIKRVDVVTGGASAAYGSDAVSGVVNFILDTDFTGLKGLAQAGVTTYGDGAQRKASLTGGLPFGGGRGHIVVSGNFFEDDGVGGYVSNRPWGKRLTSILNDNALPTRRIILDNVVLTNVTYGGTIAGSAAGTAAAANALRGIQFLPNGQTAPFNYGTYQNGLGQVGGDGAILDQTLAAAVKQRSIFGHAKYEVADRLNVFVEGSYAYVSNSYDSVTNYTSPALNPITIYSGNAYLPANIQSQMTAGGIPSFTIGRISRDLGRPHADAYNYALNLATGADYSFGADWKANVYYTHGHNIQTIYTRGGYVYLPFFAAIDAVDQGQFQTGVKNGNIVCRVTLTNPGLYPGCTPINLFGDGSVTAAARNYVTGTNVYRTAATRDVVAGSLSGTLFRLPAGPVRVGIGAEHRFDKIDQSSDPLSQITKDTTGVRGIPATVAIQRGAYLLTNAQPVAGSIKVNEGYGEVFVPVFNGAPFAHSLDLNGAVRYTSYSTSGGVTTWKGGATWEPIEGIRFRATRSRDIRAPNVAELFAGSIQAVTVITDATINPATGRARGSVSAFQQTVGNSGLQPEKADTFTVGGVLQPRFMPGFALSVDYYNIRLNGAIGTLTAQQTADQCVAGSAVACANISRDPTTGNITIIRIPQLNLQTRRVRGIDLEGSYRTTFAGGNIAMRGVFTHLLEQSQIVPGGVFTDRAGEVGNSANPDWAGTFNVNFDRGPLTLFLQERYISKGKYDATLLEVPSTAGVTLPAVGAPSQYVGYISDNNVPAFFATDATVRVRVPTDRLKNLEFSLTVNNLFDRDPPVTPNFGPAGPGLITTGLYDYLGRTFTVGVRFAL